MSVSCSARLPTPHAALDTALDALSGLQPRRKVARSRTCARKPAISTGYAAPLEPKTISFSPLLAIFVMVQRKKQSNHGAKAGRRPVVKDLVRLYDPWDRQRMRCK